jgi:hypothetical protein
VPNLPEEYGATASEAEGHAADAMRRWLSTRPFVAWRDSATETRSPSSSSTIPNSRS